MDVGGEELSKLTSPVCRQQPGCSKGNRFAHPFRFPKRQGSVDGVDGIGALRFSKIVSEAADEVTSMGANLIGAESFFHMEAFDRVAPEVWNDLQKLNSTGK